MPLPEFLDTIFPYALRTYGALTVITFLLLFLISAPYGRHTRSGWGPTIPAAWGWVIMEIPALIALPLYLAIAGDGLTPVNAIFLFLWLAHYVQRTILYPWQHRASRNRMPLVITTLAIVFNLINGFTNGWFIASIHPDYGMTWLTDPRFIIGVSLFVAGMAINKQSDRILLNLRAPGEYDYKVPRSGLHRYVAAPNYLGEIIEWTGWAIATWSPAGLLFAAYTFANLAPRAKSHLDWYRSTFPDYPGERKALIPFIW